MSNAHIMNRWLVFWPDGTRDTWVLPESFTPLEVHLHALDADIWLSACGGYLRYDANQRCYVDATTDPWSLYEPRAESETATIPVVNLGYLRR